MPNVIQPWDKEYWSKGARKRLFDEYSAGKLQEEKSLAEVREEAALQRRLKEMEKENANIIGREATEFGRRGELLTKQYGLIGGLDVEDARRRAEEAERQRQHDLALEQAQAANRTREQQEQFRRAQDALVAKRDLERKGVLEHLEGQYLQAIRADDPTVPFETAQQQARDLANRSANALEAEQFKGEFEKARLLQDNPALGFPGVYGADVRSQAEYEEALRRWQIRNNINPELAGPPPTPPTSMGGGRVSDAEGNTRKRIKLGEPRRKNRVEKLMEDYRIAQ